jgi:filamentous hemagglutinin family protein
MKTKRVLLARLMCLAVLHSSIITPLQALAQVIPNVNSGKTTVYTAPTGVTVVDINNPNAAGVSHNTYDQFNVGNKGLVLNNGGGAQITRNSQLAGQVFTNFNLGNEATLILNEVVSPNRSLLNGYIEVLGGRADVIVANPFGITCSGCGFINTPRATLTTGTPNFAANGSLSGFNVTGGDVLINGAGVDARNQALFDVLARSVRIDGQINGQEVRIVAGSNQVDYVSGNATAQAASGSVPVFAIDSSALGGMYANRIRLIATEAGVGVRMLGEAAASGDDFKLDAAGKVQLQNRISAKRDIAISSSGSALGSAGGIELSGANASLAANRDIALNAAAGVSLQAGVIRSDNDLTISGQSLIDQSATAGGVKAARFAGGNLTLNIDSAAHIDGSTWGSGGNWTGNVGALDIGGGGAGFYSGANSAAAGRSLALNSTGNLTLGNASIQSPQDLRISSAGAQTSGANALVQAGRNLTAAASGKLTLAGQWQAAGGIAFDSNNPGTALQLDNLAQVQAGGSLTIGNANNANNANNFINLINLSNSGAVLADSVHLNVADVSNSGSVQAANGVQGSVANLSNLAGASILSTGAGQNLALQVAQLNNAGNLQSGGAINLQASGAITNSGTLTTTRVADGGSAGAINLQAASITNSGVLAGAGALAANIPGIAGIGGDLINSGSLQAAGNLDLVLGGLLDNRGSASQLQSGAALTVNGAAGINNAGRIQAAGALTIGAPPPGVNRTSINNSAGAVVLADRLTVNGGFINNDGVLQGNNGVQLTLNSALNNHPNASVLTTGAGQDVRIAAGNVDNGGLLQSTGALQVTALTTLVNSGTLATIATANGGSSGNAQLQADSINNSGTLAVAGNATIAAANAANASITNTGSVQVAGNALLSSATALNNSGTNSEIVAGGTLDLTSNAASFTISNDGRIQAGGALHAGSGVHEVSNLTNSASGTVLGDTLTVSGTAVNNAGLLQGNNGAALTLSGALVNQGAANILSLNAAKAVEIRAASVNNAGLLQSGGALTALVSGDLTNSGTILTRSAATSTNGGSAGDIRTEAASINNSGVLASAGRLDATSLTGTITNSGTLQSAAGQVLNTASAINNSGAGSKILSGAALALTSSAATFEVRNDGRIQAATALTVGDADHVASLVNSPSGVVVADRLQLAGSSLNNAGVLQGGSRLQLDLSGALNNAASGILLANSANGVLLAHADSLNNLGFIQSAGVLQAATTNGISNSGTILTTGNAEGGSDGPLVLSGSSLNNSGSIVSAGTGALTSNTGTISNTKLIRAQGDLIVSAATVLQNSGGSSAIAGNANVTLTSTNGSLSVNNEGTIQAQQALTLGSSSHQVSSLTNSASGVLLGGTLTSTGGAVINQGALQGSNGVLVTASGAFDNNGKVLSTVAGGDIGLTVGSLSNSGVLQSSGDLVAQSAAALSNSGTILTQDAAGQLNLQASGINNSGIVQAANSASLSANSAAIDNTGNIAAVGALNATVATAFNNTGAASRVVGNGNITIGTTAANFTFANDGGIGAGQVLSIGSNLKPAASFINNASGVLLGNSVSINAGSASNAGTVQGANGVTIAASGALSNDGTILTTVAGQDVSISAGSVSNTGTVQSSGDVDLQSAAGVTNSGAVLTLDATGNLQIQGASITNSGVVQAANTASLSASSASIDNTGTLAATGNLSASVATAFNNTGAGAKLVSNGNITLSGSGSSFNLSNDGGVQSLQTLTLGSNAAPVAILNNNASGVLLGGSVIATAGSLTNAGTLQGDNALTLNVSSALVNSGNLLTTSATRDIALTVGSLNNTGTIQSAGDLTVQSVAAISNSGTLLTQDIAGALNLTGASITNSGMLQAANSASLTSSGALDNTGTLQSAGSFSASVATALNNTGTGAKLISGDSLTISSANASFDLINAGTVQAAGALSAGGNGHLVTLNNQSGAKLAGNSLALVAGAIDNSGRIQALSGSNVTAASFSNHGSSSVFLAAADASASTLTLSGALNNEGAIHGSGNFTINAASIVNTDTAGISSLANLNLNGSGSIGNAGALYAGAQLNIATPGTFTNSATLAAPQGTLDSGGSISVSANTFINNSSINAVGNIAISATTFKNETPGGDTRQYQRTFTGGNNLLSTDECYLAGFCSVNKQVTEHYGSTYTDTQVYTGGTPSFKPQIISSGTLTVQNFTSGTNVGGVLSAPTINLTGNGGGATFVNNDLALNQQIYARTYDVYTEYIAAGPLTYHDHETRNDSGNVLQSTTQVSSIGAGIKAGTLNAAGFGLSNLGSPFNASANAIGASAAGATSGGSASGIGAAGNLSAGSASAAGAAGGLSAANASAAGAASGGSGGSVGRANGAGNIAAGSVAGSNGAAAVGVAGVGKSGGASGVAPTNVVRLPGAAGSTISITLPTNPNGFFVTVKDPNSQFLVQANPIFQVGANTVGSDYLAQRLGFNTNTIEKRLGDSNYEAYLVRQQLIAQTGGNVLKGYRNEAAQMQALLDQAVTESAQLGLQFGQEPSADQLAHLTRDIVWMVETEVAGQRVLAPVVYLAKSTRDGIVSGAVIAANDINFDGDTLTNTGGSIIADNKLNIKAKGDITNTSGVIKGGVVSVTSTAGSILNQTVAQTSGDKFNAATTIGKTATIEAVKGLSLDAAKDITVKGGVVKAGGDASLAAGGNVTFDTIENRSSSITREGTHDNTNSKTTQTATTTNIGSSLSSGGNLAIKAGQALTIAGSSVDAKGNLAVDAKDGVNILARQDTQDTKTKSVTAGAGVGGGLFGVEKVSKDEFVGKNVASGIKVGGDASIKTDGSIVLQGSDLSVAGSAALDAADIQVLAGRDEKRSTTVTETTAFLTGAKTSGKSGTEVKTAAGADEKSRTAGASASAEATASADAEVKLFSTKKDSTNTLDITNRGSTINVGKNLSLKAKNDVTLQGADVQAGGNIGVDAKNINILTAVDVSQTSTTSEETSLKLSSSNNASAKASAGVEANGVKLSASAQAEARAKAATDNVVGIANVKTQSQEASTTNQGSVLKAGGGLNLKAKDQLTLQGSAIEAAGDVTLQAKDIKSLAAQDTHSATSNTETTVVGIYIAAEAQAGAKVEASAKVTGVGASAKADATAEAGTGLHISHETVKDASGSSTAVVSSIKSGGNLTRTAENKITDVGTQIAVAGSLTQSATTIESLAAANTAFSTSESDKHTVRVGVYGEAGASAGAEAKAGVGGAKAGANAEAHAVGGFKVGYTGNNSTENSASSTAVTGSIVVGGNFNSTSSGKTTLEATTIAVGGDTSLAASAVDFKAVQDTKTSSTTSRDIDASLKVGAGVAASAGTEGGAKVGPQGEAKLGFNLDKKSQDDASSSAVTGSLNTGGKLKITTTQGDIRLQGVDVAAGGDVQLQSAGSVVLDAAQSTTSSHTDNLSVGVQLGGKAGGGENSFSASANVGVDKGTSASNTAKTGSIKSGGDVGINAAKDVTLVGTKVAADGDVEVNAGGNVNLVAVKNTSTAQSTNVNVGVGVEASASGGSGSLDLDVALKNKNKLDSQAVSIQSGGKTKVAAAGNINQDGTVLTAGEASAGGKITTNALQKVDQDSDIRFGISADVTAEKKQKKDADGKAIEAEAKPKDKLNQALDTLTGFGKPAAKPALSAAEKAANAAKIPPFSKTKPRAQPTEEQARNAGWRDSAGKYVYPGADGFQGKSQPKTLEVGTVIDRFGGDTGTFFAPVGTPLKQRAMAPGAENDQLTKYKILKPLPVDSGAIAPWFDQPGGGTQYKAKLTAKQLIDQGYIKAVEVVPAKPVAAAPK